MDFKIDKGIEIPPCWRDKGKYPLRDMEKTNIAIEEFVYNTIHVVRARAWTGAGVKLG